MRASAACRRAPRGVDLLRRGSRPSSRRRRSRRGVEARPRPRRAACGRRRAPSWCRSPRRGAPPCDRGPSARPRGRPPRARPGPRPRATSSTREPAQAQAQLGLGLGALGRAPASRARRGVGRVDAGELLAGGDGGPLVDGQASRRCPATLVETQDLGGLDVAGGDDEARRRRPCGRRRRRAATRTAGRGGRDGHSASCARSFAARGGHGGSLRGQPPQGQLLEVAEERLRVRHGERDAALRGRPSPGRLGGEEEDEAPDERRSAAGGDRRGGRAPRAPRARPGAGRRR